MALLGSLALVHAADDLSLLVVNLLVNLGAAGGLVAVHLGWESGVQLAGLLLGGLLLAAAVGGVVLVVGGGETVGYAALVLCWVFVSCRGGEKASGCLCLCKGREEAVRVKGIMGTNWSRWPGESALCPPRSAPGAPSPEARCVGHRPRRPGRCRHLSLQT